MKKVLAIPDLHFPWHHAKRLEKVYSLIERQKPDVVIQLGDLLDRFSLSKYARSQDIITPAEEIREGREAAVAFWKNVRAAGHKKMRMIQHLGNHDARAEKRVYERFPEIAALVDFRSVYQFPNVETVDSDRTEVVIDGVIYIHGWMTRLGSHATFFDAPVVHGHTHRAGLFMVPRRGRVIWELDCGYLADPAARPLKYTSTESSNWCSGVGLVDELGPRFIPILA